MIKLNSQSYAVDTPKDLNRVEKIFKELKKKWKKLSFKD